MSFMLLSHLMLTNKTTDQNPWSCVEPRFKDKRGRVGEICVPNVAFNSTKGGVSVASALQFNNRGGLIFPLFSSDPETNTSTIIGLSIDNKTSVNLPSGSPPVRITFYQVCIKRVR